MLDHAHADAAEGFQPRDQIHDLLFRVDELHDRVVQAARRRHAQIAAHFPVGELQIWASARREKKKDCGSRRSRGSGRWRSAECAGRCLARVDSRLGRRSPEFERCLAKSRQQKNSTFVDPFLAGIVFLTKFGGKVQIQSIDTVAETVLGFLRNGVVDERCLDCLLHVLYKVLSSTKCSRNTSTSELLAGVESALFRHASVNANI